MVTYSSMRRSEAGHAMLIKHAPRLLLATFLISGSQAPSVVPPPSSTRGTSIKYFGHCCFLVESPAGIKVLIDPYEANPERTEKFRGSGFPAYQLPADGLDADVVLVTHAHGDHAYGGIHEIQRRWGDRVPVLTDGDLTIGDVHAVGTAGKHSSRNGNQAVKNVIWSLDVVHSRIVHWGDNAVLSEDQMRLLVDDGVRPIEHVDVLLLPIDAGCHLLSYDDVDQIRESIKPQFLVPMHFVIPELQPLAARLDIDATDWESLGWGPLEPWLKGHPEFVQLKSNELVLGDPKFEPGKVVVFRWPLSK